MEKTKSSPVIRKVDNQAYLPVLRELIEEGNEVRLLVSGSSMSPFLIHERDSVILKKPDQPLKKGDIVFYQRENKAFVLHRIIKVNQDDSYLIIGDNQQEWEFVKRNQIFAIVTKVNRKGKWYDKHSFWWWFFAHVWTKVIPLRSMISKAYSKIK